MSTSVLSRPRVADAAMAERGLKRWQLLAEASSDRELAAFVRDTLVPGSAAHALLEGVFGSSPFLSECLVLEPGVLRLLLERGPDEAHAVLRAELDTVPVGDRTRLMMALRRQRRRHALLIALCDLTGAWSLEQVTAALTELADRSVQLGLDHLLLEGAKRGEIALVNEVAPAEGAGIFVLGMGKHGARELNFSSDIDLIVLFDEERLPYRGPESGIAFCVRLTRGLVYLLETRTKDGYVFRTDLRLRPHPPGHPLALSSEAAEIYYERHGQNWERAALIKARVVAGDRVAGERFLKTLVPFIWRKHLDYAAIRDIHSIKRQINAHRGYGTIRVLGHDLKVGRGGIREIEFFAQTQQLILGGRVPELRLPQTCAALRALAARRWVDEAAAAELTRCYEILRSLEHRVQMVADKQTQALPEREADFQKLAAFAGFADAGELERLLLDTFLTVERHYAALFESEPDLGAGGSLVFTGTADDPETLKTLAEMGFKEPSQISARIREWHHGHIRATRSTRARELLTELMPSLLKALQQQPDGDAAFRLFDEFVTGLPAGVQLFSLFRANPELLKLLTDLMGTAPRLARHLSRNVDLFDAMLTPDFFERLPGRPMLEAELRSKLADARDLQDILDICRRWAHGRQFQAGLQVLLGIAPAGAASRALAAIAEVVIAALLPAAESWLVAQHGAIEGGAFAVIGLGKLGSHELTVGSDLDLVFVYDAAEDAVSQGAKPLPAATYYARLGQRLVSALTAKTSEGQLYEIDMRLRPSGNVGPVATSLANFARYHAETAQTWEQQALTRARAIAGDPALCRKVEDAIWANLARPREPGPLGQAVRAMRERIFKEHGSEDPWNLKHARGGIVEIEFTAQYLKLLHAHAVPGLRTTETQVIFAVVRDEGLLPPDEAEGLARAHALHQCLQAVLRLSLSDRFEPKAAPPRLLEALVRAAALALEGEPPPEDFATLARRLVESQADVRQIFARLCPPA
ncbi:bifunctional [glutamine synthetase] adenylyltransferase/[glutamine synthetase]-adenylyl-L-tyrosine phosphorylase [Benzoatithermus flavus]|uniref:Bifunctional glutamine synthetase adenylyltransferase/adenylyl-removing enzyme n=1 Tax=Benzoatithermus flavus TaxID=3108223 RepID=A0ABU8XNL4_9PROT